MLLGGLWHGAAWTFVIWGALHGALSLHQPRLEQLWSGGWAALRASGQCCRVRADVPRGRRRLGVLPRRQHGLAIQSCRRWQARLISAWVTARCWPAALVAGYAMLAWFAPNTQEIMGYDHHNRTVGEAWAHGRSAGRYLCERGAARLRGPRNPAAQRIHLFQVLMSVPAKNLIRFLAAGLTAALLVAAFNFVVDPLQLFGIFTSAAIGIPPIAECRTPASFEARISTLSSWVPR